MRITPNLALLAAVIVVASLSNAPGAGADGNDARAAQAPSAAALLRAAVRDALAQSSVHEVEAESSPLISGTLTADVGPKQGRQTLTHSGGERGAVIVVGGSAYFSGNQAALINYFGLPSAVARGVGTRWVAVPASTAGYAVVADGATLPSVLGSFDVSGHLTLTAPTTVDGQSVVGIHGTSAAAGLAASTATVTVTIYVTRSHAPLPVRADYSFSTGGHATLTLSDWGEHLVVMGPAYAIPVAELQQ